MAEKFFPDRILTKMSMDEPQDENQGASVEFQNPSDFSKLVEENIAMLRAFVFRIVLNEHDCDDIVQDAFVTAYNKINEFRHKSKFSTWLCSIAYRLSLDHLRKKKRHIGMEQAMDCFHKIASPKSSPETLLLADEVHLRIEKELSELPEHFRMAITLVAVHGLDHSEASQIIGCTRPTLYWRLFKARKILEHKLGDLIA